jgi:hypothetical protein
MLGGDVHMNNDALKAIIEYVIANSPDGDYILQAQTLAAMNPQGW